jgi:hypothetical protein
MLVKITQIDAGFKFLCTEKPMVNGPAFPELPELQIEFWDESNYPILTDEEGKYTTAPLFWGSCSDTADTSLTGVIAVLTQEEYDADKLAEAKARKPFASWIFDEATLAWHSPIAKPEDGKDYLWDEATTSWVEQTPPEVPAA